MAAAGDLTNSGISTDEKVKVSTGAKSPLYSSSSRILYHLPPELRLQITNYLVQADELLVRLQRLFTSASNIEAFLAPLQYSACLVSYLQQQRGSSTRTGSTTAAVLNDVVGGWRNTLRLLQIPVLYTLLRQLLSESEGNSDVLVWRIKVAQCVLYLIYQVLENVAHLIDLGLLPSTSVPVPLYRDQTTLWLHSNRFWLLGISCDLVRLAREAMLERTRRQASRTGKRAYHRSRAEQEQVDKQWWHELTMAGCTWPLCLHWSLENGMSKFNDGIIGVLGVLASYETLRQQWEATETG